MLRTITCALVSARGAPCLDAVPLAGNTNEAAAFRIGFDELVRAHDSRFQLISYDAGAAASYNAATVVRAGKDYLFALKDDQPLKVRTARWLLEDQPVVARTDDTLSNHRSVVRTLRWAPVRGLSKGQEPIFWPSTKTVVEVTAETHERGVVVAREARLFLCSLDRAALSPEQWLLAVRRHWGVENDCHRTFDIIFDEDDHPWIDMNPQGTLVVLLLRRLAYNLLTLFRSVTQRDEQRRAMPWKELLSWVEWTLLVATDEHDHGLRVRKAAAVFD